MNKLDAFKKLIREEVRKVFKEEIKALLQELKTPTTTQSIPGGYKKALKETVTAPVQKKFTPPQPTGDPIKDLLAETATAMTGDEYKTLVSLGSNSAQGFPQMFAQQEEVQVVSSVEDMIASTGPVHDINQVEIDTVPDFSGLMNTLKSKGQI
jgi:hypothetical protein